MNAKIITLNMGGTKEKQVVLSELAIPDLWRVANNQADPTDREMILEVWHLAHDLVKHLQNS